ncbi:MAG: hypothetical protein ACREO1_12935 [Arenimonas sp.]
MALDALLPLIEEIRREGALVLLKWDGERTESVTTVLITRKDTNYVFHKDSNDAASALHEAILDYRKDHPRPA